MHSDILNYTKLAFDSLKMIQNDTVYQPIKDACVLDSARLVFIRDSVNQNNLGYTTNLYMNAFQSVG